MELINWCAYYHNALEDKPDMYTYENDLLMDEWVKEKELKRKHKSRGGKSASDHGEVIHFGGANA